MNSSTVPHDQVAIVGAGFGAIAAAIRLRQAGVEDFVMIDRADEVGGVWRDNSYPGAAVDVKSHLYSLSSAPNPDWHNVFARRGELYAYLRDVADRFDLRRRLVLGCEVEEMRWDGEEQRWELDTAAGPRTAQHVVVATGVLAEPVVPDLPGLENFEGPRFHSARWDHGVDLAGKRVAVIGTGASAVQFVPAIAPTVAHLTLFQRTPPWIMPRHDHEISARTRRMFRALPFTQRLTRAAIYLRFEWMIVAFWHPRLMRIAEQAARRHLRQQVPDPELRRRLTPDYSLGCKRILLSDDYLPSLTRPNVSVNTDGIAEVTARGVLDRTGVEHEVDAIVLGTGFRTMGLPLTDRIHDAAGVSMRESWGGRPTSYLGTAVAGYPNCFLMHGPNIGTGHNSVLHMFESQANYIAAAVTYARDHGLAAVQPTRAAQDTYSAEIEAMSDGTVWTAGGCQSWYLDEQGRNVNIWPGTTFGFRRRTRSFDPAAHLVHRPLPKPAAVHVSVAGPIEEPA